MASKLARRVLETGLAAPARNEVPRQGLSDNAVVCAQESRTVQ